MGKLESKTVIISGAARGIGTSVAILFAEHGANVVLVDIDECYETSRRLAEKNARFIDIPTDVSDIKAVQKMVREVMDKIGAVDILVNNAGVISRTSFTELTNEEWRRVLDVNLGDTYNCCKCVVPVMIENGGGKIVNVSSVAGKVGDITASPAYGTSKGAINTFTKSLARQLAPFGIYVNAVAPHAIETDMSKQCNERLLRTKGFQRIRNSGRSLEHDCGRMPHKREETDSRA